MKPWLGYLLVLLLAGATLDDAWAVATPDPSDDAVAVQNNEYLPSATQDGHKRPYAGGRFLPGGPAAGTDLSTASAAAPRPEARACAPAGPPLLYLLMNLRR